MGWRGGGDIQSKYLNNNNYIDSYQDNYYRHDKTKDRKT